MVRQTFCLCLLVVQTARCPGPEDNGYTTLASLPSLLSPTTSERMRHVTHWTDQQLLPPITSPLTPLQATSTYPTLSPPYPVPDSPRRMGALLGQLLVANGMAETTDGAKDPLELLLPPVGQEFRRCQQLFREAIKNGSLSGTGSSFWPNAIG